MSPNFKWTAVVLVLAVATSHTSGQKTAEEWYKKGVDLGEYEPDEAIQAYDEAIRLDPMYAKPWNNKGVILAERGEHDEAIQAYDEAIRLDPMYAMAWNNKGRSLEEQGKYAEAVKAYDEAISFKPEFNNAWINKGSALEKLGKHGEAILCYDEIINRTSGYDKARLFYLKSVALYNQGERNDAIRTINEAIEINPGYADNWNAILANETINMLDEAISINPKNVTAWINKGDTLKRLGKPGEAIKAYDEAIRLDPNNISIRFSKARALLLIGESSNATKVYDEASKLAPKNAYIWIVQGQNLSLMKHVCYRYCPYAEEAIRCFDRAIKIYEEAIRLNPSNATPWNNKGYALYSQVMLDASVYSGSFAPDWVDRYAHARYREDKLKEALNCFDKATQLDPSLPAPWINKGASLWNLASDDDTSEYYKNILSCFNKAREAFNTTEGDGQKDALCIPILEAQVVEEDAKYKYLELQLKPQQHDVSRVAAYT